MWTFSFWNQRLKGTSGWDVHNKWATWANLATSIGIVLVLVNCWLFLTNTAVWLIMPFYILAIATDPLDGLLADYWDEYHTYLGKILDPLRDRLIVGAQLANLLFISTENLAPIFILVGTELWIAGLGLLYGVIAGEVGRVHQVGKWRAMVHWFAGTAVLAQYYWLGKTVINPLLLLMLMSSASTVAAIFYTWRSWDLIQFHTYDTATKVKRMWLCD